MNAIPPFDLIRRSLDIAPENGALRVSLGYDAFIGILKLFLAAVPVDAAFYRGEYPDIAAAEREGRIESLQKHFVEDGYFEGRLPCAPAVDEAWYLAANPDVAEGIKAGVIASAQEHFVRNGYREGRRPDAT